MSSFTINQVKRKKKLVRVEKVLVLLFFFCTVTQGNKHTFVCLIATYSTETVLFLNITHFITTVAHSFSSIPNMKLFTCKNSP